LQIKYFLPEGSFVKKEESGIFYLNTVKELFFNDSKKTSEGVLIKESIHIMFSGVPVNLITEISGLILLREFKLSLSYKTLYLAFNMLFISTKLIFNFYL
jgi:hypothetical protein